MAQARIWYQSFVHPVEQAPYMQRLQAPGGLPILLFARESPFVIDGAPVLNGIAVVAKAAETALALKAITKVVVSRRGTYAKAPAAAISEFKARLR